MKSIQVSTFKSSKLNSEFSLVQSIQIESSPFDSGAFGEVYHCKSINQSTIAAHQVIKVFIDDGSGSAIRGHETINKLQDKIVEQNNYLNQKKEKPIQDINALFALPQFSFKGSLSGKKVLGYSANFLPKTDWLLFSQIFNEENLAKRKLLRNNFYKLPIDQRLKMAYDLVEGFSQLEQMNFIYADLNPKNFFVSEKRSSLCLIDFEGGAVNENPETYGKPGEWLAPEIQEQLLNSNSPIIKVDLNTDTWAVAIAVHFMLFNFHPLFFLKIRGKREMQEYFKYYKWPVIVKSSSNFRYEVSKIYDSYIDKINVEVPKPLVNAFSETINNGFTNPNKRLSYRQWLRIIEAFIKLNKQQPFATSTIALGNQKGPSNLSQKKNPPTTSSQNSNSIQSNTSQLNQPTYSSASPATPPIAYPTIQKEKASKHNYIKYAVIGGLLLLTLLIYNQFVTTGGNPPSKNTDDKMVTKVPDYEVQAFYLRFTDSNLQALVTSNGKISNTLVKYIQPILVFDNITKSNRIEVFIKIIGPNGKVVSRQNISPNGFTYSQNVEISPSTQLEEFELTQIDLNCPKCGKGSYKFEIYIDSKLVKSQTYIIN